MTLDTIDRAFVTRWQARRVQPAVLAPAEDADPSASTEEGDAAPAASADEPLGSLSIPEPVAAAHVEESLADRLLVKGREQWECLADEVEAARLDGHRAIAIVGGEPGEGRSTLVECLGRTLRDRGRDVVVLTTTADLTDVDGTPTDGGRLHDRRIVLIDAGIWFPPGPIRRQRLVTESVGCDAAILVRRADRDHVPARATALAALGMTVLGEVVTFAPSDGEN